MEDFRKSELAEFATEVEFETVQSVVDEFDVELRDIVFVKWGEMELCLDKMNGFAFADISLPDETGNPFSCWKTITPGSPSASDALDFPVLDGKSVRERFAECRFFVE